MTIERDRLTSITPIPRRETASDTLVGDKFIDVTSGTSATLPAAGRRTAVQKHGLMQRLDISQFQKQMHQIELVLDEIERRHHPWVSSSRARRSHDDLRNKITELQRGIHVAADTTTAVGQALCTDELYRKVTEPLRQLTPARHAFRPGRGSGGAPLHDNPAV